MPNTQDDLLQALKQYYDETDPLLPTFQRSAYSIKALIFNKHISANDQVPSTTQISGTLEINVMTASKSLQSLREEHVIIKRRGNPYVVAEDAVDIITEMIAEDLQSGAVKFLQFTMKHFNISKTKLSEWMKE